MKSGLSSTDYVTGEGWRLARLACCPLHPRGGCGFARHGSYARVSPAGTRIARWYCPTGHCTFSLLPDHLAARFPGTLSEIEHVVATVEQAKSLEAAADRLRSDDITLPSAVRWVRRRVAAVRSLLTIVVGLFPQWLQGCTPAITEVRSRLVCGEAGWREPAGVRIRADGPGLAGECGRARAATSMLRRTPSANVPR